MGTIPPHVKAHGDWQTPPDFAKSVLQHLSRPSAVLEPTCGRGAFLKAAQEVWPEAAIFGFDISSKYVEEAKTEVPGATLSTQDFFNANWGEIIGGLPKPLLILGNPPWVTSSTLRGHPNRPSSSGHALQGLDALLGKANFDISEWMILKLLEASFGQEVSLVMLCKTSVARKVIAKAPSLSGSLRPFSAKQVFGAAVDAVLLTIQSHAGPWLTFDTWDASHPNGHLEVERGRIFQSSGDLEATRFLEGGFGKQWRSGIKHDCSSVMVLPAKGGPDLEPDFVYPYVKGSQLHRGGSPLRVIVPQKTIGAATEVIRDAAPKTWAYLEDHRALLEARKSRVYHGRPDFSIFGVGPYAFAPWKAAIAAFYPNPQVAVWGPIEGQPVMFDDTCYFLACQSEEEALEIQALLHSDLAQRFLRARIFRGTKRPITKALLQSLSLDGVKA